MSKEEINLPPIAGPFVQSLRSIGYSLDAAVADLVDNSISAKCHEVHIRALWRNSKPMLWMSDDGEGMSPDELASAMQLGAVGPDAVRDKKDLGRFGLGLKTASFSQCKTLHVISRDSDQVEWCGLTWDLDFVAKTNKWSVLKLNTNDIESLISDLDFSPNVGTHVIWEEFDQAVDATALNGEKDFNNNLAHLKDHLAITFHRFIRPRSELDRIKIFFNGSEVKPRDPFAEFPISDKDPSSVVEEDEIRLMADAGETRVKIKSYVLPHPSLVSSEYKTRINGEGTDYYSGQGIYIYRAGRLISYGSWLRIVRNAETNKLARIQIDFENDADGLWQIDVKKSRVNLPSSLKSKIREVIKRTTKKSSRTFNRRAQMSSFDSSPIWQRVYDKDNKAVAYKLNHENDLVNALIAGLNDEQKVLMKLVEKTIPVELIKNDIAANELTSEREVGDEVIMIVEKLMQCGFDKDVIKETLLGDSNLGLKKEMVDKLLKDMV